MHYSSTGHLDIAISFFLYPTRNIQYFRPVSFYRAFLKYIKELDKHLLSKNLIHNRFIPLERKIKLREKELHQLQKSVNARLNKGINK